MRIWMGALPPRCINRCSICLRAISNRGHIPLTRRFQRNLSFLRCTAWEGSRFARAIEELVGEGYLTKRQGRGTFVTATKIIRKVHQKDDVQSFTQACAENGMKAGARVVARKTVAADRDLASFFGLDEGSDLILVSRVRTADGVPVLFENNYYPVDGFEFLKDIGLSNCSIFEAVGERTGRYPCSSDPCRLEIARAGIDAGPRAQGPSRGAAVLHERGLSRFQRRALLLWQTVLRGFALQLRYLAALSHTALFSYCRGRSV